LIWFSGIFYKLRDILPTSYLRKLYFSLVQRHIAYGIDVYANTNATVLDKLHKLNNMLLHILQGQKLHTPVSQQYTQYNVLPISLFHEMKIITIVHKYVYHKKLLPDVYRNYFTESSLIHLHNTRIKQDFHFLMLLLCLESVVLHFMAVCFGTVYRMILSCVHLYNYFL